MYLSWLGLVTTEGRLIDLDDGDMTIVRNWCFERKTWLSPRLDVVAEIMRQPSDERRTYPPYLVTDRSAEDERAWLHTVFQHHRR